MMPYEAVTSVLTSTSTISALIGGKRYTHGSRPKDSTYPNLTFYEVGGPVGKNGIESQWFSFGCRAKTIEAALALARAVLQRFHGSASTGIHGHQNGFEISGSHQTGSPGIIFESDVYNVPVDIMFTYPTSTVS